MGKKNTKVGQKLKDIVVIVLNKEMKKSFPCLIYTVDNKERKQ